MFPSGPAARARCIGLATLVALALLQAPGSRDVPVEALVREAENLAYLEAFLPARRLLETALRAAKFRADPSLEALCLDRIGSVLDFEGQPGAGADRHRRALALAREIADERLEASVLASIGHAHWRQADYGRALTALREALAIQERISDEPGRARTLLFIGRVHFKKAEYAEARGPYHQAAATFTALSDRQWLSVALEDLGDLALEQGLFVEALESFGLALEARRQGADPAGEAYMLNVIGRVYLAQASHRRALTWFEGAAVLARQHKNRGALALALYHMGIARGGLDDQDGALQAYGEALVLKRELGDRRQQAWILGHMGDVRVRQRHVAAALEHYQHAIRIWEEIGDPRGLATGLSRAARLSFELGRYQASLDAYRRAGELLGAAHPAYLATAVSGMGRVYAAAGDRVRALEHGRRAVAIARGGPDDVRWAAARALGWIERRLGDREQALASYQEGLRVIEALRTRTVPSADVRADFLEAKQTVYSETVDLLFEMGRIEDAFEVAERARTRAFLDMLHEKKLGARSTPAPVTLAGARHEARRTGGAIVEYFSAEDRLFIWVLGSRGSVQAVSVPISRAELAGLTGALRRAMVVTEAAHVRPLLQRLHRVLVEPVAHLLPRQRDRLVTIVPHGPLFLISFAALLDERGTYLVERHTLAYSPSVSVLPYTNANRRRAVRSPSQHAAPLALIVGNPAMPDSSDEARPLPLLPDAEREARQIGALFPSARVRVLTGTAASEREFRHLAPAHTLIHLATHAAVLDDAPMRSYLALAPDSPAVASSHDPPHDGLLRVADILELDLRAGLVTLAACDTGLGHVSGEGVVGLSRAFIYAGAASVLVSLWRVADAIVSTEMQLFYSEVVRSGGHKAAALARAQRRMIALLRDGKLEAGGQRLLETPLFWAAFVLVGEAA